MEVCYMEACYVEVKKKMSKSMKKVRILPFIWVMLLWLGFGACQTRIDDEPPTSYSSGESAVEVSVLSSPATRSAEYGTPDESVIDNLDILLFDSAGKFVCWRTTFKVNGKLRTTLPIGEDYDACFLANCRPFIEKMLPDKAAVDRYVGKADWEVFRQELVDMDPQRLLQDDASFTSLPMWGILEKQEVKDQVINYWPLLTLTRSVASVDIYVAADIADFALEDATLYHVPDKGFLGNVPGNIIDYQAQDASSPADMATSVTLESDAYDATGRSISNRLYLYDNDTENETANRRHTRLVIGAGYKGTKYYYPIDFEDTGADKLIKIIRNRKYVFNIHSVSGPGYTDKETAAEQPPIHLNVNIIEWNMTEGQMGSGGNYYLWTEKREITLYRETNSTAVIGMKSNILSEVIMLSFRTDANGAATALANGIQNNRFKVKLINDAEGYPIQLKATALGDFDTDTAAANSDTVVLLSGRIRLEIKLSRYNQGKNDWELDGDIDVDFDASGALSHLPNRYNYNKN